MAIIFFEGLPRAGKSYEAMVTQIIPALQKGREVVAYIEGLNVERIAEAAELPVERVRELLFPLTRDDMRNVEKDEGRRKVMTDGPWITKTRDNALHVFDEAQNWWGNKHKASEAMTQFVTEHGHRGIDILLMGQALSDVLKLWRNRVDQKFAFLKLSALGAEGRYSVTVWKGKGNDEYEKVGTKPGKYDKKYFGTYASHVATDTNTLNYVDKRATVWASSGMKFGLPLVLLIGIGASWYLWRMFNPEPVAEKPKPVATQPAQQGQQGVNPPHHRTNAAPVVPEVKPDARSVQERYFAKLSDDSRIRLVGLLEMKGRTAGVVEWRADGGGRIAERLDLDQLRDLGVSVMVIRGAVRLTLGEWQALATMWPIEVDGKVPSAQVERQKPGTVVVESAPVTVVASAGPVREPAGELTRQAPRQPQGYEQSLALRNAQVRSAFEGR